MINIGIWLDKKKAKVVILEGEVEELKTLS